MTDFAQQVLNIMKGDTADDAAVVAKCGVDNVDEFRLIVKHNICYIVGCVIFSDNDEVLLIQESKKSCRGLWYLPAGRVDPKETLLDAVRRETKEEAGYDFEPEALIYVEPEQTTWYRFTFMGRIVGGSLKTFEDKESIQAKWWPVSDIDHNPELRLRCHDIVYLIKKANQYRKRQNQAFSRINVTVKPHRHLALRLMICQKNSDFPSILKLVMDKKTNCLPSLIIKRGLNDSINVMLIQVFKTKKTPISPTLHGVISFEHDGTKLDSNDDHFYYDGFCMTLLISVDTLDTKMRKGYSWFNVVDDVNSELFEAVQNCLEPSMSSVCPIGSVYTS